MHLVIYFCGTGDSGQVFNQAADYIKDSGAKVIVVQGCEQPAICHSSLFPDLKEFSKRFVTNVFKRTNDNKLTVTDDSLFGVYDSFCSAFTDPDDPIEEITLCGYSRGAVTCFEVARELNKIAPEITIDIRANQPVPGNAYEVPFTNAKSVADCRDLNNLRNVSVILGSYTGDVQGSNIHIMSKIPDKVNDYKNSYILTNKNNVLALQFVDFAGKIDKINVKLEDIVRLCNNQKIDPMVNGSYFVKTDIMNYFMGHCPELPDEKNMLIHKGFFSQIVPKLPNKANRKLIAIPRESHHQNRVNAPSGDKHMHMEIARSLHESGLIDKNVLDEKTEEARQTYSTDSTIMPSSFPAINKLQNFFGISAKEVYQNLDELHPATEILKQGKISENNEIYDTTSEKGTKVLLNLLARQQFKTENKEELTKLFRNADYWLMSKANTSNKDYFTIQNARNNIADYLTKACGMDESTLIKISYDNMHATNYLLNTWQNASKTASHFKTDETKLLDKAFQVHATKSSSKENDVLLKDALQSWINTKSENGTLGKSKRYPLVINMLEQLKETMNVKYGAEKTHTIKSK